MNKRSVFLSIGKIAVTIAVVCGVVSIIGIWRSSALQNDKRAQARQETIASLRKGIDEIQFASVDSSHAEVSVSVESFARFVDARAGVTLSERLRTRLAAMERSTLKGHTERIPAEDLSDILTSWLFGQIGSLSDQEVDRAIETLRGFDAPDLPDSFKRGRRFIQPRASQIGPEVTPALVAEIKSLRDQAAAGDQSFKALLGSFVSREVEHIGRLLPDALPDRFTKRTTASEKESLQLTPLQAALIAYAVVSDDPLTGSLAGQRKHMRAVQEWQIKKRGHYPDPEMYKPYGVNGYTYSSPVDLFLDEASVDRLLTLLEQRRRA